MVLYSSRPHRLLRPLIHGFHASARALVRADLLEFLNLGSWEPAAEPHEEESVAGEAAQGVRARCVGAAAGVRV
jgi:hypothetical protein